MVKEVFGFKLFNLNNVSTVIDFVVSNGKCLGFLGLNEEEVEQIRELAKTREFEAIKDLIGEPVSWAVADIINDIEAISLITGLETNGNELIGIDPRYAWALSENDAAIFLSYEGSVALLNKYAELLGITDNPTFIESTMEF